MSISAKSRALARTGPIGVLALGLGYTAVQAEDSSGHPDLRIQIRDARSGKLLDQREANFAGGEEGWAAGVRRLIKHQILASAN